MAFAGFDGETGRSWGRRPARFFGGTDLHIVDVERMFPAVVEALLEDQARELAKIEAVLIGPAILPLKIGQLEPQPHPPAGRQRPLAVEQRDRPRPGVRRILQVQARRLVGRQSFFRKTPEGERVAPIVPIRTVVFRCLERHPPITPRGGSPFQTQRVRWRAEVDGLHRKLAVGQLEFARRNDFAFASIERSIGKAVVEDDVVRIGRLGPNGGAAERKQHCGEGQSDFAVHGGWGFLAGSAGFSHANAQLTFPR